MRKTLIAVAVVAAGALAYYQFAGKSGAVPELAELAYVPADTALFSGQFTPIDLGSYLTSLGMGPQYYDANMQQAFGDMLNESNEAQNKFVLALLQTYMKALSDPANLSASTGVKPQMRSLVYLVGMSPVMRIELGDEASFWRLFDEAEKSSGFSHVAQQINDVKYRQYRLVKEQVALDFLVSVKNGFATLALSSDKFDAQHLAIVVQAAQPEQNLANTSLLADVQKKYQLNKDSVGFLSSEQLLKFVTSTDGNRLAKDVNAVFGQELGVALAAWRNPACVADVAAISKSWPGLYMDSQFDLKDASKIKVSGRLLVPTENADTVAQLSALRGFIPAQLQDPANSAMLHTAVGLDVAQLAPTLGKLWTGLTEPAYSCEPLAQMQQQAKQNNPLAALAMAGMASGLQGISVTLHDVELDLTNGSPKNADALLTISATNARAFVEGIKAFYPPLAAVALPAAGEELDVATVVPEVAVLGVQPKLAMTDSHLLLYVGNKAKAQSAEIGKESLSKNGLLSFGLDYGSFFKTMQQAMAATGEEVPADFQTFANSDMKMQMSVNVNNQGFVLQSQMQVSAKAQAAAAAPATSAGQ
ncbi:hypothetical protein [Rheinheimera sp. 4Y26]|uniref:hypothetical protein n=1 Tax=Rheinheimera sp. 4Y26 TaxID=2977811 RepID=UPI0021B0F231|nr:hypothetical protein [Rheinheimera sp. 4Y26]MCT6700424.1 hypothetical protein [Rheinheimera sp. 4Y26]